MDFTVSKLEENVRRILQNERHLSHPTGRDLYKRDLYETPEISSFREMLKRTFKLYGEKTALHLKDPRPFGLEVEFDKRGLAKRMPDYKKLTYREYIRDIMAIASVLYALPVFEEELPETVEGGLTQAFAQAKEASFKPRNFSRATAVCGDNRYEWYLTYLAAGQGSTKIVPLDKELPIDELISCLQRAHCDTLFISGDLQKKIVARWTELPELKRIVCFDKPAKDCLYFWDLLSEGRAIYEKNPFVWELDCDPEAVSALLFTSGTTSRSKVVMLSQKSILYELDASLKIFKVDSQDRFLSVLPVHHTYECSCGFILPVYIGAELAISEGLRYIASNIQEVEPTVMLVVPLMLETFYNKLLRKLRSSLAKTHGFKIALTFSRFSQMVGLDPSQRLFKKVHEAFPGIKRFIVGGAAVDATLLGNWTALGFKTSQGYGMTETSPIVALNPDYAPKDKAAGLPIPGTEIRIINPDENGIGEVIVKGPGMMIGYYEDPEKTSSVIDEEGFYHTGDLGYLDEDYYLILTGRKSNLIVSKNGKNIFPEEIEFLLKQYPLIEEVVVRMGRDARGEEQLIAEIFASRSFMEDNEELQGLDLDHPVVNDRCLQIIKEVNSKLVSYKHLRSIFLRREPFPMTSTRKVKRGELNKAD
ncbi:MAG: AMP-binding protein [Eubacteriales bacterium]|nr:AMP-binding protein [Eubacteriales bacterium]